MPEDGVYHYGFKAYSKPYQDYLYLYDIRLVSDKDGEIISDITPNASKVIVTSEHRTLRIYNPENEDVAIYNSLGVKLYMSNDSYIETNQTPGLYIVKSTKGSKKVIVK